jgi:hypothetical protein
MDLYRALLLFICVIGLGCGKELSPANTEFSGNATLVEYFQNGSSKSCELRKDQTRQLSDLLKSAKWRRSWASRATKKRVIANDVNLTISGGIVLMGHDEFTLESVGLSSTQFGFLVCPI